MAHASGLLLKNPSLVERIGTLFAELKEDEALQAAFIKSPNEVVGEGALPSASAPRQASAVNEFIFSVLADKGLQRWLEKYRGDTRARDYSPEQKLHDLARAFIACGAITLPDGTEISLGMEIRAISSISRTYIRTLNNSVTAITRINPPQKREITSMQIVSMAEQLLHRANSKQVPTEVKTS